MTKYQRVLLDLISSQAPFFAKKDSPAFAQQVKEALVTFSPEEFAHLYVDIGFLQSILKFLEEQHWLQKKAQPNTELIFKNFVDAYLKAELAPRLFLHDLLQTSSHANSKILATKARLAEALILQILKTKSHQDKKSFSTLVLLLISDLFEFENQLLNEKNLHGEPMGLSMYRTYDGLDQIFNLNYHADVGMQTEIDNTERLYEGAGVGVQSGYSTVLTALRYLNPEQGSRFIDLGCGYGRLGIVIGLLRPDIDFVGYEYVQHRVDIAMSTIANLHLQSHVHIYTQDLSAQNFHIPDAEIYYMYDPFSEATYAHVLSQLVGISQRKKIAIATKGNARNWLIDIAEHQAWPPPQEFDNGNLCLFCSE